MSHQEAPHIKVSFFPFFVIGGAVSSLILLLWLGAIVVSSRDYLSEGPDTKIARSLEAPLNFIFRNVSDLGLPWAPALAITFGLPVLVLSVLLALVLRNWKGRQKLGLMG